MSKKNGNPVKTMSDLLALVQKDREAMMSGDMSESKARLCIGFHKLVLKGGELNLQFARMQRGKHPERELQLIGA